MKTSIIALAFAAFAASGLAQAADNTADNTTATQTVPFSTSHGGALPKTRADVRRELVQAQNDGQFARLNALYRGS